MEHNRQRIPFNTKAIKFFHSNFIESLAFVNDHSCQNELGDINCNFYKDWDSSVGTIDELHLMGRGKLKLLESYNISDVEEGLVNSADQFAENTDSLIPPVEPEITSTIDITPENPSLGSDSLEMDNDSLSSANAGFDEFLGGVRDSINTSVNKGGNVVQISLDTITSSITSIKEGASEAVDDALGKIFSTFDQTGELPGDRLTSFSSGLREATKKATGTSVDVLRGAIIAVEESITKVAYFVVYSYGPAKDLLPPEIRDALNLSEERVTEILRPVGATFQQVHYTLHVLLRWPLRLLSPVRLGVEAFSLVAGKLENNCIGLPTSPSSSDVQNRVLQAAAKHESHPSETEVQNSSPESVTPLNEKIDLSEA